jgi:hypothetical protein
MDKIPIPSRLDLVKWSSTYWDKEDGIPHRIYLKSVSRATADEDIHRLNPRIAMFTWLWDVRDSIEDEIHDRGIVEWPGA